MSWFALAYVVPVGLLAWIAFDVSAGVRHLRDIHTALQALQVEASATERHALEAVRALEQLRKIS